MIRRTMDDVMAAMPAERRARIQARTAETKAEVEALRALRLLADRSQERIAQALDVEQPAEFKIERQTDLYLSILRHFVEATEGTLQLRVELPGKGVMHLTGMGELAP